MIYSVLPSVMGTVVDEWGMVVVKLFPSPPGEYLEVYVVVGIVVKNRRKSRQVCVCICGMLLGLELKVAGVAMPITVLYRVGEK